MIYLTYKLSNRNIDFRCFKLPLELQFIHARNFFQVLDAGTTFSLMQVEADDETFIGWKVVVIGQERVTAGDPQQ